MPQEFKSISDSAASIPPNFLRFIDNLHGIKLFPVPLPNEELLKYSNHYLSVALDSVLYELFSRHMTGEKQIEVFPEKDEDLIILSMRLSSELTRRHRNE